jgi:hypothetical protein
MKKIKYLFLTVIVILLASASYAQDIIITTKAEKISAKVTEVDVEVIKYKMFDYQDGPTYTIKKSEIASIIYQNGQVEVFEQTKAEESKKPEQEAKPSSMDADYMYFKRLDDDAMSKFLERNDDESYRIFHSGEKLKTAGKAVLIPGIVLSAGGLVVAIVGEALWDFYIAISGYSMLAAGQICIITSIPLMAVGGGLKAKGKNTYEDKFFKNQRAQLNFNIHPGAVGLSLKF